MPDRRIHPRLDVPLEVRYRQRGSALWLEGTLANLSAGGAALLSTQEIRAGSSTPVELRFTVPGDDKQPETPVQVQATVVRCEVDDVGAEAPYAKYRIGLRFQGLDQATFRRLQLFVFRSLIRAAPRSVARMTLEKQRVSLRRPILVQYDGENEPVKASATDLSMKGLFVATTNVRPPGTQLEFELWGADGSVAFQGRARVMWTRSPSEDAEEEESPRSGMGVRFLELEPGAQHAIEDIVKDQLSHWEQGVETEASPGPMALGSAPGLGREAQRQRRVPEPTTRKALERRLSEAVDARRQARESLQEVEATLEDREVELAEARATIEGLEREVAALGSQLERAAFAEAEIAAGRLEVKDSLREVEATLDDRESELAEARALIERLEKELAAQRATAGPEGRSPTGSEAGSDATSGAGAEARILALRADLENALRARESLSKRLREAHMEIKKQRTASPPAVVGSETEAATSGLSRLALAGLLLLASGAGALTGFLVFGRDDLRSTPEVAIRAEASEPEPVASDPSSGAAVESRTPASEAAPTSEPEEVAAAPAPRPDPAAMTEAWAEAWSAQRIDEYLAFYSERFVPPDGLSREAWEASRRRRLSAPAWIRVTVESLEAESDENTARVVFEQTYENPGYRDRVRKRLDLVFEGDGWKILEEETLS